MAMILIAEDEPTLAEMLGQHLKNKGFDVTIASDGTQMLLLAKEVKPNLIVADVMMPGTYGTSAYKMLQEDPATQGIPVLFLTAITPEQAAALIPEGPGVRVMHKPAEMKEFVAAVESMLHEV
ncbi:MAG: hypothetical protein COB53_09120 [Elusimicrobia bacterium]|nr:MAG: hypothetical protein COB53_09120 [Elusimicrobiota bacterium]